MCSYGRIWMFSLRIVCLYVHGCVAKRHIVLVYNVMRCRRIKALQMFKRKLFYIGIRTVQFWRFVEQRDWCLNMVVYTVSPPGGSLSPWTRVSEVAIIVNALSCSTRITHCSCISNGRARPIRDLTLGSGVDGGIIHSLEMCQSLMMMPLR